MYYVVWDMFCGWSAYDSRVHIIAEGESGKFYELTPPPWGELHPYGFIGRQHYDSFNNHSARIGMNVLAHTSHEPMTRVFVVEEAWAKKFNLPEAVWLARHGTPKEIEKYYRIRTVLLPDGMNVQNFGSWLSFQSMQALANNPRLHQEASRQRSVFAQAPEIRGRDMTVTPGMKTGQSFAPVGAPSGN
jgi:hypothetical protein